MIVAPPLLAGAVNVTTACVLPISAATLVGAPGTVTGVRAEPAAPPLPVPVELVAVTAKV